MQALKQQNKGSHLNTIERFYIYAEYLNNNHLNDDHTIFPNTIFEALLKPHQPYPPPHTHNLEWPHQVPIHPKTRNITDTQQYRKLPHRKNNTHHTTNISSEYHYQWTNSHSAKSRGQCTAHTYILVNNHKKYSGPKHKDSIIRQQPECTTQMKEDYTHTHTPRTEPRHPRNWGRTIEDHFHLPIYPLP